MKNVYEQMAEIGAKEKIASFIVKQKQDHGFKKQYAAVRVREFIDECNRRELNTHVSVGGLDSITLYLFVRSLGYDVPGISASHLEGIGIRKVHKALGIESVKPVRQADGTPWTKERVLQEFGFPVLSKEIAAKIELLQHPTEKNKTVRHAIITGETGEYGGWQKNSRMKMSQKWLEKFGGYENENEGVDYGKPDFLVSSKCCYYLKERPCDDWAREHNSVPFLGLMASEGGRRQKALMMHGCNYFGKSAIRSAPFAIFDRQDVLKLALEMDEWYRCNRSLFPGGVDTIIPAEYGEIVNENGALRTTRAQRTGCDICGFGIHLEKRPHRFDRLLEDNPAAYDHWMFDCCEREDGSRYGWAHVLDYIGVSYENTRK